MPLFAALLGALATGKGALAAAAAANPVTAVIGGSLILGYGIYIIVQRASDSEELIYTQSKWQHCEQQQTANSSSNSGTASPFQHHLKDYVNRLGENLNEKWRQQLSSHSTTTAASVGSQTSESDAVKIQIEKEALIFQQIQEREYRRKGEKKGKKEQENPTQPTRIRWFWNSGVDQATGVTVWTQFSDADCDRIEAAFNRGQDQVQLRDGFSVNLTLRIRHETSNRNNRWNVKRVEEGTPYDTESDTEEEALKKAKQASGIREDQACDSYYVEDDRQNPGLRCLVLVYQVNGVVVKIRRDNAVTYSNGKKQRSHFNAGPDMKQHHYF